MNAPVRIGNWIQTFTGGQFWPLDPRPEEISIIDIAAALSKKCRYGGHCVKFYSVAEHSVHVARNAPDDAKLAALLHDAGEGYLPDVPSPVKPFIQGFHDIEERVMEAVARRFHIPWPLPSIVKEIDTNILNDEMAQGMAPPPAPWRHGGHLLGVDLQFWTPQQAEFEFLAAFHEFGGVA